MPYRSDKAQNIHQSLLRLLHEPSDSHFAAFSQALSEADESSLMEKSINDDSHLIDIFHLSHEIIDDKAPASHVVNRLFKALMERCRELPSTKAFLLLSSNHMGFTPLHDALKSGNPQNMVAYFEEVKMAVSQKIISNEEYRHLLIGSNQAGFTPLHQVLKSGNHKNMRIYFDELKNAVIQGMISLDDYQELLTKPNHAGFTPLHEAAFSGNFKITQCFFEELVRIHPKKTVYTCLMTKTKGHLPSCPPENPQADRINTYLEQQRKDFSKHREPRPEHIVRLIQSDQQDLNRKRKNIGDDSVSIQHQRSRAFSCRHVFFAQSEPQRQVYYVQEGTKKFG